MIVVDSNSIQLYLHGFFYNVGRSEASRVGTFLSINVSHWIFMCMRRSGITRSEPDSHAVATSIHAVGIIALETLGCLGPLLEAIASRSLFSRFRLEQLCLIATL
jgi:hypothetical protein